MAKKPTYTLTDHLCRECGGRVLQVASGGGPSAGGNPTFRCADCGFSSTGMGVDCVCWCGFQHRSRARRPYQCLPFDGNEHLDIAFAKNGFRMFHGGEVGVIQAADYTPRTGKEGSDD